MNADVEFHIKHNYAWAKLPGNIRQVKKQLLILNSITTENLLTNASSNCGDGI